MLSLMSYEINKTVRNPQIINQYLYEMTIMEFYGKTFFDSVITFTRSYGHHGYTCTNKDI